MTPARLEARVPPSRRALAARRALPWAAVLALAVESSGCLQQVREEPPQPTPVPRMTRLAMITRGISKFAVIEPVDRTDQGAGLSAAAALVQALGAAKVPVLSSPVRRPGNALARSWLVAQTRSLGVDGFVSGSISAFAVQPHRDRAYVALTAVVLDGAGEILWSRRVAGSSALAGLTAALPNEGLLGNNGTLAIPPSLDQAGIHRDALAVAALIAAKEFAHDLAAEPQP